MSTLNNMRCPGSAMVVDLAGTLSSTHYCSDSEDFSEEEEEEEYQLRNTADKEPRPQLNIEDLEDELSDVATPAPVKSEPVVRRRSVQDFITNSTAKPKRELISAETILLQPEMKLLRIDKEREMNKQQQVDPYQRKAEDEFALVKRFPWLADKLKHAWQDDKSQKGKGKMKTGLNMGHSKEGQKRTRFPTGTKSTGSNNSSGEKEGQQKVVFSRNIPLFIYNPEQKKGIRVGGDRTNQTKSNLEEVYRAIHFNPELKKITLDLEDLRFPEKEKTVRLALSYISANTLHNPFVLNDDFYKYSWKKELIIKDIVQQIERRLQRQLDQRTKRKSRLQQIDDAITHQKEEEELRERDFVTANRLLEESKEIDQEVLTQYEKNQERKRRIRLRTKSMPIAARADVKVRQRRFGVAHITLKPD